MRNALLCVLAGAVAGFAIIRFLDGEAPEPPPVARELPAHAAPVPTFAPRADTSLSAPRAAAKEPAPEDLALDEPASDASELASPVADELDGLVAAGFSPPRAAAILQREAQLRHAAHAAEYQATGSVRPFGSHARSSAGAAQLRAELGDADYERYLEGTGQPHRVVVRDVEADSLAAHAGILPGDEIRTYAGERVFNQRELNALMLAGTLGEVVPTTVVRDGQSLHLYVRRGPLGLM